VKKEKSASRKEGISGSEDLGAKKQKRNGGGERGGERGKGRVPYFGRQGGQRKTIEGREASELITFMKKNTRKSGGKEEKRKKRKGLQAVFSHKKK